MILFISTEPIMTDGNILSEVLDEENTVEEEYMDGDASEVTTCPYSGDVRQALNVLQNYMLLRDNEESIPNCINQISAVVETELLVKLRQTNIRNFFQ